MCTHFEDVQELSILNIIFRVAKEGIDMEA